MAWLTKSRFLSGLQCRLRLWSEVHAPLEQNFADNLPFVNGRTVDSLVQALHPGAVISRASGLPAAIAETSRVLASGRAATLYQPAFRAGDLAVIADVLRVGRTAAELVEVKASVSVKDAHIADVGFQTLVLRAARIPVRQVFIGHVDNTFVLRAPGDYAGLILEEDVTPEVESRLSGIADQAAELLGVMASTAKPTVAMGPQCQSPYACPFIDRCSATRGTAPRYPIGLLPGNGRIIASLAAEGYADLADVPREKLHSDKHRRIHEATLTGEPFFDAAATQSLRALPFPMTYLDFETIGLAVPEVVGTRPYQPLPFQWSVHIEDSTQALRHVEYLAVAAFGEFEALARPLIEAIPAEGPVFAYNAPFERSVLTDLAARLPDRAVALKAIARRLVDLMPVARAAYYHRDMQGSWSIKNILPTIDAALAYDTLGEVRDGGGAQMAFLELRRNETRAVRRQLLARDLLEYCKRDTFGLVVLRRFLCGQPIGG